MEQIKMNDNVREQLEQEKENKELAQKDLKHLLNNIINNKLPFDISLNNGEYNYTKKNIEKKYGAVNWLLKLNPDKREPLPKHSKFSKGTSN